MKPIWASKTLWANLIAAVAVLATMFGVDLGLGIEQQATLLAGIMSIVNIALRFVTTTGVSVSGDT
jgi:hypothetical protein